LLFLVVQRKRESDEELESSLTDLDLEISNDSDFHLVNVSVLALPRSSEETISSFLSSAFVFRYIVNGN